MLRCDLYFAFFFFNDTATTEIYTLSLHDALPISRIFRSHSAPSLIASLLPEQRQFLECGTVGVAEQHGVFVRLERRPRPIREDRKSTRLNSSHQIISYAVFCLKKKIMTSSPRATA